MSSQDQSACQNAIQDAQELAKVVEEGNVHTGIDAANAEQPEHVQERDVPAELSDDELAVIAGGGAQRVSIAKITNTEFVKSGVAGLTGTAAGIVSYAITHAINQGKTPNTPI
jgi:hypothetical protein